MSEARDPGGQHGPNDPEYRVGRGKPARRRIAALAIGIIVTIFAVLLVIWLLGRSAADAQGTGGDGSHASGPAAPITWAGGAAELVHRG